ncbi:hypothetical protein [Xylanibacter ruminicola]|nr:hypothetical protein [Xylanibacter ruminicola]
MKTSKQIEIWRDILSHYDDDPERQEQLFRELINELRKHLLPR